MASTSTYTFVDDLTKLSTFLSNLDGLPTLPPSLYIDLEGNNLSRSGTVSIVQVYIAPLDHVYLLDITSLGSKAFTHSTSGSSLGSILQDANVPKAFFDVRQDSDALFAHYQIALAGVVDLQLMELATRQGRITMVNGLARCIQYDIDMSEAEKQAWLARKEQGKRLFGPEYGGSYAVFDERPLSEDIKQYCVQDVVRLPLLWRVYWEKMSAQWEARVGAETVERVRRSQMVGYRSKGREDALSPKSWLGVKRNLGRVRVAPVVDLKGKV